MTTRHRATPSILLCLVVSALTACTPPTNGPLEGPRVAAGDAEICAPLGSEDQSVYFGEPLRNSGADPVLIESVSAVGTGVGGSSFLLDHEAPSLGQELGAFLWPTGVDPIGPEAEVMARSVDPVGQSVEPGASVWLLQRVEPRGRDEDAVSTRIEVRYVSGKKAYTELIEVAHRVRASDAC